MAQEELTPHVLALIMKTQKVQTQPYPPSGGTSSITATLEASVGVPGSCGYSSRAEVDVSRSLSGDLSELPFRRPDRTLERGMSAQRCEGPAAAGDAMISQEVPVEVQASAARAHADVEVRHVGSDLKYLIAQRSWLPAPDPSRVREHTDMWGRPPQGIRRAENGRMMTPLTTVIRRARLRG